MKKSTTEIYIWCSFHSRLGVVTFHHPNAQEFVLKTAAEASSPIPLLLDDHHKMDRDVFECEVGQSSVFVNLAQINCKWDNIIVEGRQVERCLPFVVSDLNVKGGTRGGFQRAHFIKALCISIIFKSSVDFVYLVKFELLFTSE